MSQLVAYDMPLSGLRLINRKPIGDQRGYFERLFCQDSLGSILREKTVRQINRTFTRRAGAVRGMHFQYPPNHEVKIISCLRGRVWDVAVDLRRGSSTFLKYHAVILSEDDSHSYYVPEGFAHGFQTLTSDCELLYFHTADYNAAAEGCLNAIDLRVGIEWPLAITERSERDERSPLLTDSFLGIEIL